MSDSPEEKKLSPAFQKRKDAALKRAREAAEKRKTPDPILGPLPPASVPDTNGGTRDPNLPAEAFDYRFQPRKCTPALLKVFLETFRKTGIVSRACKAAGICPSTISRLRNTNPHFAEVYDLCRKEAVDMLEEEARRRAFEGVEKPVFYKGTEVGVVREYSDKLLEFLLTYNHPEKFGGNSKHRDADGGGSGKAQPPVMVQLNVFSDPQKGVIRVEQQKTDGDNAAVRVDTPRVSDGRMELHGERGQESGGGMAPPSR